jgi:hypothetical protein
VNTGILVVVEVMLMHFAKFKMQENVICYFPGKKKCIIWSGKCSNKNRVSDSKLYLAKS